MPSETLKEGPPTSFAFGQCPVAVAGPRRRLDLKLDLLEDGTTATGYNPSLIRLPEALLDAIPAGRWLAAIRVGDEHWPSSACQHPAIKLSREASDSVPPLTLIMGASRGDFEAIEQAAARADKTFELLPRTFLAVLDENFQVLTRTVLKVRHGVGPVDDASVQDARIHAFDDGRIFITFQPYYLQQSWSGLLGKSNWKHKEVIALLHVNATEKKLNAWVDREEARALQECPERGLMAPGPKKNLGLFRHKGKVYGLDWVYPTRVGAVNVEELAIPKASGSQHFEPLCYGYGPVVEPPPSPWAGVLSWTRERETEEVTIHNGTPLIWLEELGEFLGVGHVQRFMETPRSRMYPFYLQQFFTVKGDPSDGTPFTISRVGPEFCLETLDSSGKCETIQVITSLLRVDDSTAQIGYGVMDCESYVMELDIKEIMTSLTTLA